MSCIPNVAIKIFLLPESTNAGDNRDYANLIETVGVCSSCPKAHAKMRAHRLQDAGAPTES